MALAAPLTLGTMIIGSAILGRLMLHEWVTVAMACSLLILVSAVFVLSVGAGEATESAEQHRMGALSGPGERGRPPEAVRQVGMASNTLANAPDITRHVVAGVGAACLSGLAYALLGVAIRLVVTDKMSVSMTMVTVTLTGVIALGIASLWTPGVKAILQTSASDFQFMLLAGLFNAASDAARDARPTHKSK